MASRPRLVVGALAAVLAGGVGVVPLAFGGATDTASFSLKFDGRHAIDETLPAGVRHDGRFTASPPFCPSGRAYDVKHYQRASVLDLERVHTCDDGSGSFTAFIPSARNEHGETGAWTIIAGTGHYETLRGIGRYDSRVVSGNLDLYDTIVYWTQWQGVVGFDAEPPAVGTFTVSARKLRRPARTYVLRVALAAREANGPVAYVVDVSAGRTALDLKQATSASGQAVITARIRAPRGARTVVVELTARDVLGNVAAATRSVRLP